MNNKSQQIKQIIAKIDTGKIINYQQKYPNSKTLRYIIKCNKRISESNNDQLIFKLATDLAYYLNDTCNPEKANYYVKNEEEKKHFLAISEELFRNTVGIKEEKVTKRQTSK